MVPGTRDNPPPNSLRQLYRAFVCGNVAPVGQVKMDPARLFITLNE